MPIVFLFSLSTLFSVEDTNVALSQELRYIDSPLFVDAIRLDDLDGSSIVLLSKSKQITPLLYPKLLSVTDFVDCSKNRFYTLEDLSRNPLLISRPSKGSDWPKKFVSGEPIESNVFLREKKVFDPSLLLHRKRTNSLPSDEQLNAFVSRGKRQTPDPVTQRKIIQNLLTDEYADHPVASLLIESNYVVDHVPLLQGNEISSSPTPKFELPDQVTLASADYPTSSTRSLVAPKTENAFEALEVPEPVNPRSTSLKLLARKPTRNGDLLPAQASEIYLTTRDLKELLSGMYTEPLIAGEVKSVAELWAKAEKNVENDPEVALGVKSILLQAKVKRARTDPFGKASLEDLPPDEKFFLIGIDKDDSTNVVTIWSKEVDMEPGENSVELSSTDVIYQE